MRESALVRGDIHADGRSANHANAAVCQRPSQRLYALPGVGACLSRAHDRDHRALKQSQISLEIELLRRLFKTQKAARKLG